MTTAAYVPKRRVTTLFRRVRELGGSRASWTRVEPGPTRARTWGVRVVYGLWAICIATMIGWGVALVRGVVRWENLRSRGENVTASVVQTWYTGNDNDGYQYYLRAYVDRCDCTFVVRVMNPQAHRSGTPIPIRFDPRDHSNVVPRVDRPADWLGVALACFVAIWIAAALLLTTWLRTRRRCKAVLNSQAQPIPVKFRAWQRMFGNSNVQYLVLYDAESPAWDEPLCCVPVFSTSLRKLSAPDILMLYGNGMHGAAALRRERKIILPSGPVKSGRWEQSLRFA